MPLWRQVETPSTASRITGIAILPALLSTSVSIFIGETVDILEISKSTNRFQQFQESLLALAADCIIHIICVENGSCIVGGEVASPNDRQLGESCSHFAAGGDGTNRLWSGHHRNRQ